MNTSAHRLPEQITTDLKVLLSLWQNVLGLLSRSDPFVPAGALRPSGRGPPPVPDSGRRMKEDRFAVLILFMDF